MQPWQPQPPLPLHGATQPSFAAQPWAPPQQPQSGGWAAPQSSQASAASPPSFSQAAGQPRQPPMYSAGMGAGAATGHSTRPLPAPLPRYGSGFTTGSTSTTGSAGVHLSTGSAPGAPTLADSRGQTAMGFAAPQRTFEPPAQPPSRPQLQPPSQQP